MYINTRNCFQIVIGFRFFFGGKDGEIRWAHRNLNIGFRAQRVFYFPYMFLIDMFAHFTRLASR